MNKELIPSAARIESIGKKIRDTELKKIPYMLIVGEKEAAEGNISVRRQGSGDQGAESIEDFIKDLKEQIG